jgi:hypothetical protein
MVVVLMFVFGGCAKLPQQEIDDAKAAVESAVQAGANTYTPDEIKQLNDELTAAVDEANQIAGKLFKSTAEVKAKLVKIKENADTLKTTVAAKKEEAKNAAIAVQAEAKTAIDEAKANLELAPKGKGTMADIEAFKADITAMEESQAEVQKAIDGEDYLGAAEKAKTIKEKAVAISEQIKAAIEKVATKKGGKKK